MTGPNRDVRFGVRFCSIVIEIVGYVNIRVGHKMHVDVNISVAHTGRGVIKLIYPKNWNV